MRCTSESFLTLTAVCGDVCEQRTTILLDPKIGFTCEVFERNESVGGTWYYTDDVGVDKYGFPVYSPMYSGLQTNLPKEVMGYPDFKYPDQERSYLSQEEVLAFFNSYADQHKLRPHIKFLTMVKEIRPLPKNRWSIKIIDIPTKVETTKEFDAVMVCSGHFNEGLYPNIPGRENFKGHEVHSHDFRKSDPFVGKKVLIIGAGPSGIDIGCIVAKVAESVILSYKSNNPIPSEFPPKVNLKADVTKITETGAEFADGTNINFDVIIYCTGYKYKFPFLSDECKIVIEDFVYMRPLYKHMINIEYPTMFFTGIPYRACSIPMYDLQVRYYMQFLKGTMKLPSKEKMYEHTAQDIEKRKQMGFTKKQYHLMSKEFVWDYYKSLSDEAKIENIWTSIVNLRLDGAKQVFMNLLTYHNDRYKIVDKDNYIKL